jgi:hypothetical protein
MLSDCCMKGSFLLNFQNEYQRIECIEKINLKTFGWSLEPMLNYCYMENNFLTNFQNENQKIECIMKNII